MGKKEKKSKSTKKTKTGYIKLKFRDENRLAIKMRNISALDIARAIELLKIQFEKETDLSYAMASDMFSIAMERVK